MSANKTYILKYWLIAIATIFYVLFAEVIVILTNIPAWSFYERISNTANLFATTTILGLLAVIINTAHPGKIRLTKFLLWIVVNWKSIKPIPHKLLEQR
ncbi:MAG: hypothetical protein ACHBN1_37650 [Heteroscytonema crispum UTEX LB 1556]